MRYADAKTIHLKDYQAPEFGIETTVLHFDLFEEFAVVESTLHMKRSPNAQELILQGRNLVLEELRLNGTKLFEDRSGEGSADVRRGGGGEVAAHDGRAHRRPWPR